MQTLEEVTDEDVPLICPPDWNVTTQIQPLPSLTPTKLIAQIVDSENPLDGVLGYVARDKSDGRRHTIYHPAVVSMRVLLDCENYISDVC